MLCDWLGHRLELFSAQRVLKNVTAVQYRTERVPLANIAGNDLVKRVYRDEIDFEATQYRVDLDYATTRDPVEIDSTTTSQDKHKTITIQTRVDLDILLNEVDSTSGRCLIDDRTKSGRDRTLSGRDRTITGRQTTFFPKMHAV